MSANLRFENKTAANLRLPGSTNVKHSSSSNPLFMCLGSEKKTLNYIIMDPAYGRFDLS